MTTLQTLEIVLEALESCTPADTSTGHVVWPSYDEQAVEQAIAALRTQIALEKMAENERELGIQMQPDEPTYYLSHDGHLMTPSRAKFLGFPSDCMTALYTRPQPAAQFAGSYGIIDESAAKRIATALGWEPKREWVGLSDEDKQIAFDDTQEASGGFWEFADAIEAKLKSKNEHS